MPYSDKKGITRGALMGRFFEKLVVAVTHDNGNGNEGSELHVILEHALRRDTGILFVFTLLYSVALMGLLGILQLYPGFDFALSEELVRVYLYLLGGYVVINQVNIWFIDKRVFRRGHYVLGVWLTLGLISGLIHFFSNGSKPFPEDLKDVLVWSVLFIVGSKVSSALKHAACRGWRTVFCPIELPKRDSEE